MSYGDELMAAGQAENEYKRTGRPVRIVDRNGNARRSELWDGNPAISQNCDDVIVNGPGCRPYIEYPFFIESGQKFSKWKAANNRGKFYPTQSERALASSIIRGGPFAIVEPNISEKANPNKHWHGYQAVVESSNWIRWIQLGPAGTKRLYGVSHIVTPSFRDAIAILGAARLYVGPEGGLHHAAAIMKTPAIVLFGGYPTDTTGYPEHVNMTGPNPHDGWVPWEPCEHCREQMQSITVNMVIDEIRKQWAEP